MTLGFPYVMEYPSDCAVAWMQERQIPSTLWTMLEDRLNEFMDNRSERTLAEAQGIWRSLLVVISDAPRDIYDSVLYTGNSCWFDWLRLGMW